MKGRRFLLLLACLLAACAAVRPVVWEYRPQSSPSNEAPMAKSVGVPAIEDARPTSNVQNIVYYSPPSKFPEGTLDYARPEEMNFFADAAYYVGDEGKKWAFQPAVDIRAAVAQELRQAGLFKEVRDENWGSGADYMLRIRLVATRYTATIQGYGMSLWSLLQWMVFLFQRPGLTPTWSARNELEVELALTPSGSATPLWHYRIQKQREIESVDWAFRRPKSDFFFDQLLGEGLKEALADLARALREARGGAGGVQSLGLGAESAAASENGQREVCVANSNLCLGTSDSAGSLGRPCRPFLRRLRIFFSSS